LNFNYWKTQVEVRGNQNFEFSWAMNHGRKKSIEKIPKIDFGRANPRILINLRNLSSDWLKKVRIKIDCVGAFRGKTIVRFGYKYLFMARQ